MFPTFGPDGTLYFSSDGKGGKGGLDIFRVTGAASEAVNMGDTINSPQDDFGIWMNPDERSGYFSSNRFGTDDVLMFRKAK